MAYQVLARKWRPKQFEQVVGQGHVTRTLQNAIKLEKLARPSVVKTLVLISIHA
jgi:DNA polymerase-3 subunit gamma/tau